jgi:ribosomal protein L20A (L18A)
MTNGALKREWWVGRPMQAFRTTGTFPNGRTVQAFTKDVVAADEVDARHRIYSFFGSRHGVNRRFVNIESVAQIEPTESNEPVVISAFRDTHDFTSVQAVAEEE